MSQPARDESVRGNPLSDDATIVTSASAAGGADPHIPPAAASTCLHDLTGVAAAPGREGQTASRSSMSVDSETSLYDGEVGRSASDQEWSQNTTVTVRMQKFQLERLQQLSNAAPSLLLSRQAMPPPGGSVSSVGGPSSAPAAPSSTAAEGSGDVVGLPATFPALLGDVIVTRGGMSQHPVGAGAIGGQTRLQLPTQGMAPPPPIGTDRQQPMMAPGVPASASSTGATANSAASPAAAANAQGSRKRNVYVSSLPVSITTADLHGLFSPFGAILSCTVENPKQKAGVNKSFGFVLFEFAESAAAAIATLHRARMGDSILQVRLAKDTAGVRHIVDQHRGKHGSQSPGHPGSTSTGGGSMMLMPAPMPAPSSLPGALLGGGGGQQILQLPPGMILMSDAHGNLIAVPQSQLAPMSGPGGAPLAFAPPSQSPSGHTATLEPSHAACGMPPATGGAFYAAMPPPTAMAPHFHPATAPQWVMPPPGGSFPPGVMLAPPPGGAVPPPFLVMNPAGHGSIPQPPPSHNPGASRGPASHPSQGRQAMQHQQQQPPHAPPQGMQWMPAAPGGGGYVLPPPATMQPQQQQPPQQLGVHGSAPMMYMMPQRQ